MNKPLPKVLAAAAAVLTAAACVMVMDPGTRSSWEPRGEFRKTLAFAPGGTISLENDFGDVEVSGWDKDSVEIVAQGPAGRPERERKVRAYGFWEVKPDVEVLQTESGLTVRTRAFDGPGEPPPVDYTLRVPQSVILDGIRIGRGSLTVADVFGRLRAEIDRGDLAVANFSGSVDVSLGTGNADVEVLDLRDRDAVLVSSREGDIVLRLEPGADALVEAEAPRGEVRSALDLGVKTPVASVSGRLGSGGARITLKAAGGRIDILAVKDVPRASRENIGR